MTIQAMSGLLYSRGRAVPDLYPNAFMGEDVASQDRMVEASRRNS